MCDEVLQNKQIINVKTKCNIFDLNKRDYHKNKKNTQMILTFSVLYSYYYLPHVMGFEMEFGISKMSLIKSYNT